MNTDLTIRDVDKLDAELILGIVEMVRDHAGVMETPVHLTDLQGYAHTLMMLLAVANDLFDVGQDDGGGPHHEWIVQSSQALYALQRQLDRLDKDQ
jgi:hypothetical protein